MSVKLRTRDLSKGKRRFYLDIYKDGTRFTESLDLYLEPKSPFNKESKRIAEQIRAQKEIEINTTPYNVAPLHKSKTNFISYWTVFLESYKGKDFRMFKYCLSKFIEFLELEYATNSIKARELTPQVCEEFMQYLQNEAGLSGETPSNYFARFKRVTKKAIRDRVIAIDPTMGLSISRSNTTLVKQVLTVEELKALKQTTAGNDEVKRAFLFACFTGLGLAEIRKLCWANLTDNTLRITRSKLEKKGISINNKLPQSAIDCLGSPGKPNDFVFNLKTDTAVSKVLKQWVAKAGIQKNISFYCGRHTFAVMLLQESETNIKTVADCLGHTSLKHTMKYLNHVDKAKDKALSSLPLID